MSKRIGLLFVFLSSFEALFAQENVQKKPNILWMVMEDTSPHFIGCYGNKNARTPVIDQLAKEGIRFKNAFSTGTVCSPSRSCIITGMKTYKTGTGNHRSNYPIPEFIKGFPYYVQKEGYYTTNNSKTDYNVANAAQFTAEAWNESSGKAGWWNRKQGQPFFAVFNFNDSHQSKTMTEPYSTYQKTILDELAQEDRIGDNEFEMPSFYNDTPEMRKQMARVYNSIKLTDIKIGKLLERLEKEHLKDSTIIFLYADHGEGIPRGKTNGINLGYRVPFVVYIPEMYRRLSPWGRSGVITDELIDFEDLAPTIISLAGGKIPEHMNGKVLMGRDKSKVAKHLFLSSDRADNGIDMVRSVTNGRYMYSRNFMPFMPEVRDIHYMEIADIKKQMRKDLSENKLNVTQKQLFEDRPAEFLFDVENDKWEINNLANNPKYKAVLESMRKQLKAEILKSKDIMFLPEYEMVQISKTSTPYEFRQNAQNYPLTQIYEAAALSGFRGKDITEKQISLLKSPNEIIRYWAMIGLKSQSKSNLQTYSDAILKAMNDTYLPVAVTASAIGFQEFNNEQAKENMTKFCQSKNADLALMALNYLLYFSNKQPFIETVESLSKTSDIKYDIKAACLDFLGILGLIPNNFDTK